MPTSHLTLLLALTATLAPTDLRATAESLRATFDPQQAPAPNARRAATWRSEAGFLSGVEP